MTRRELSDLIDGLPAETEINLVLRCAEDEVMEDGSVLKILDAGFVNGVGQVLYVEPV